MKNQVVEQIFQGSISTVFTNRMSADSDPAKLLPTVARAKLRWLGNAGNHGKMA